MAYKLVPRNVNMNELQNGRWACRSATKPLNYRDHRVSRTRSSKRFPSIPKDQLFFIPFRSSVYSEIDVLARLFKFSLSFSLFRPFSLDIPSLCPSYVTHVRYVIVRRPRPARHEWVTHADRPRVCVAACVRCLATCAIHALARPFFVRRRACVALLTRYLHHPAKLHP